MTLHRSMQGKLVDMAKLAQKNELTPAVSNEKVNARGDKIGPGGKIIQRREEQMASYYQNIPKSGAVSQPAVVADQTQPVVAEAQTPPEVLPPTKAPATKKSEE